MNRFRHVSSELDDREKALSSLKVTIGNRVRRVCVNMPEPEFVKMVDTMARVHLKYETLI
ncbi:MAG: hypothetical protein ABI875_06350 [Gemmatimonadales bacterium]